MGATMSPADADDAGVLPIEAVEEGCLAACETEAGCRPGVSASACTNDCIAGAMVLGGSCAERVADEAACLGDLSCDELEAYVADRRGHVGCGEFTSTVLAECAINGGMPPAACTAYCEVLEGCGISQVPRQTCADNCLLVLTGLERSDGAACADVQTRGFDCFAGLSCAEQDQMIRTGLTAAACAHLDEELFEACR